MDQVENTSIRFVSRGVGKWGKWDKWRKWKSQVMCVTLGLALGVVAHLMAGMEQDLAQGYILKRNSYGQGDTPYQLLVRGLEADGGGAGSQPVGTHLYKGRSPQGL